MNDWELCKENIQPLVRGRKISYLNEALAQKSEECIRNTQQEFETKLRIYSGEEKLETWHKYICWAEENFPGGGKGGNLDKLIISCIKHFQEEKIFQDDERYIDIWLKYINHSSSSLELYPYMHSLGVGQKSSYLYRAWAFQLDQLGNTKKAYSVIQQGLQAFAEPRNMLLNFQKDLNGKVMRSVSEEISTNSQQVKENFQIFPEQEEKRSALVGLMPLGRKLNKAPIDRISNTIGSAIPDQQAQMSKLNKAKSSIKIWTDENSNATESRFHKGAPLSSVRPFVTQAEQRKENEIKPGKWSKAKVLTKGEKSVSVGSTLTQRADFNVHHDEEKYLEENQAPRKLPSSFGILSMRSDEFCPAVALFEPPDPKRIYLFNHALVYGGAKEMSFEEIRAASLFKKMQVKLQNEKIHEELSRLKKENENLKTLIPDFDGSSRASSERNSPASFQAHGMERCNKQIESSSSPQFGKQSFTSTTKVVFDMWNGTLRANNPKYLAEKNHNEQNNMESYSELEVFPNENVCPLVEAKLETLTETDKHKIPPNDVFEGENGKSELFQQNVENNERNDKPNFNIYEDVDNKPSSPILVDATDGIAKCTSSKKPQFEIFRDPTEDIFVSNERVTKTVRISSQEDNDVLNDSLKENRPCEKETDVRSVKRTFSGILQPSTTIPFVPLEDQNTDNESDDDDGDLGIKPIDLVPNLLEEIETGAMFSSTPFPWVKGVPLGNKPFIVEDNHTIAIEIKKAPHVSVPLGKTKSGHRKMDPSSQLSLGKCLSPIVEANSEASKSSSSSCSSHQTTNFTMHGFTTRNYTTAASQLLQNRNEFGISQNKHKDELDAPHMIECNAEMLPKVIKIEKDFDVFATGTFMECLDHANFKPKGQNLHLATLLPKVKTDSLLSLKTNSGKVLSYQISSVIGEGGFGKVYKACDTAQKPVALKVSRKQLTWETYVTELLQERLKHLNLEFDTINCFLTFDNSFIFSNGSILVTDYYPSGTLVDLVNMFKSERKAVPEELVLYFTKELIHILSSLHRCNLIHADIKPDNFLLTALPLFKDLFHENHLKRTSCLKLIDFGQTIDLQSFEAGITFNNKVGTDGFQCPEMLEGKPWTFQTDLFGLLGTIHILLFSEYMQIKKTADGQWELIRKFRRYWKKHLWQKLFTTLLNIPNCKEIPDLKAFLPELEELLLKMERPLNDAFKFISQMLKRDN